jgi:hypothetical protein
VLEGLDFKTPWTSSRRWAARSQEAVEEVETALRAAGLGIDAVMARTLSVRIADIDRIDRMTMAAEARRTAALREIQHNRAAFARHVERAIGGLEETGLEAAELKMIAPHHAPAALPA